jgi:ABC-2 type transport system permease protein
MTTALPRPAATTEAARPRPGYVHAEILRTFRNFRFFIFSLVFPLVLFLFIAGPQRDQHVQGIPLPTYFMAGMVAWGTMAAVIAGGARISMERQVGWSRQLRVTPLSARRYLGTKVLTGYVMALASIVLLYGAGVLLGVRLSALDWIEMTALILIGLIPFALMGIAIGHLITPDSLGPALGGLTSLFALLGGSWGPIASQTGWLHQVVELLPSYWLVQAGHVATADGAWTAEAWIVILVWSVAMARLAQWAFRRDTERQ